MNASTYPHTPLYSQQVARPQQAWVRNLLILLVIQFAITISIYSYQRTSQPQQDARSLLDFNLDTIDRLSISDATTTVTLTNVANSWQLPGFYQLPVDTQKLNGLLDKLKGTKLTWPVTTTESSHERFEVADNKFQRRVEFFAGDKKQGEILLGSSPGFKKVHVRRAGDKDVFAVELSGFEFATGNTDWLKKDALVAKQVREIHGTDFKLRKNGDHWQFIDDGAAKVNTSKANELAETFSSFLIDDVVTVKPETEPITLGLKVADGEWQYQFINTGEHYLVKRNDRDLYFKISSQYYESMALVKRSDLIMMPEDEEQVTHINEKLK